MRYLTSVLHCEPSSQDEIDEAIVERANLWIRLPCYDGSRYIDEVATTRQMSMDISARVDGFAKYPSDIGLGIAINPRLLSSKSRNYAVRAINIMLAQGGYYSRQVLFESITIAMLGRLDRGTYEAIANMDDLYVKETGVLNIGRATQVFDDIYKINRYMPSYDSVRRRIINLQTIGRPQ